MTSLLQENSYNYKSTLVPGTPINHRRLVFNDGESSDTGTRTGGYVGGPMSAAKYDGGSGTPRLDMLLQLEGTSDIPIIIWFSDLYMLDSTALFVK